MLVRFDQYVLAGYIVTCYADGDSVNSWSRSVHHIEEDLLPARFLSVAFCGAPRASIYGWSYIDDDYAAMGIPTERQADLKTWLDARTMHEVDNYHYFWSLSLAREFISRFSATPDELVILGIGLHQERKPLVFELETARQRAYVENNKEREYPPLAQHQLSTAIERDLKLVPGEVLGYDLVCCDAGLDHSWHCNGLTVDALEKFDFRPNSFGLIEDKANADKLGNYCNLPNAHKGEPGVWLPVLVTRYATGYLEE